MSEKDLRGQRIIRITAILEDMLQTALPVDVRKLNEIAALLAQLDNAEAPMLGYNEVSSQTLRDRGVDPIRRMLQSPLHYIMSLFHGGTLLNPSEQWTIVVGTPCGFTMEFTMRLIHTGTCEVPDDIIKNMGSGVQEQTQAYEDHDFDEAVEKPASIERKPAAPTDEWDALLKDLDLREEDGKPTPKPKVKRTRKPRIVKKEPEEDAS